MPSVGLENGTPSSRMGGDGQDVESTESNESSAGEADSLDSTRLDSLETRLSHLEEPARERKWI